MSARVGAGSDSRVALPAVLTPYAAATLLRLVPDLPQQMRQAAARARRSGNPGPAAQLEQGAMFVAESARQHREWVARETGVSVDGNTEAGSSEIGSESGVQSEPPPTLDTATAAVLLGCSQRRIVQMLAPGGLLSGRRMGRVWVVDRESVDALRETRRAG